MSDIEHFGLVILAMAIIGLLAILSNRLSERTRVPAPAMSWSPRRSGGICAGPEGAV